MNAEQTVTHEAVQAGPPSLTATPPHASLLAGSSWAPGSARALISGPSPAGLGGPDAQRSFAAAQAPAPLVASVTAVPWRGPAAADWSLGRTAGGQEPGATSRAQSQRNEAEATLPEASHVLAVIARPGQEASDLGAVLSAYHLRGARLSLLCLTQGEASEINSTCERLETVRPAELQAAAEMLGVESVTVADYPDGRLGYVPVSALTEHVVRAVRHDGADLVLVADPAASGDSDTAAVARSACLAARQEGLAVLARTLPGPGLRWRAGLGTEAPAVRARQRLAIGAHSSQRVGPPGESDAHPSSPADSGDWEMVRWLVSPVPRPQRARAQATVRTSP